MDRRKFLKSLFVGGVAVAIGAKGLKEILTKEPEIHARPQEDFTVFNDIDTELEFTTILSNDIANNIDKELLRTFK